MNELTVPRVFLHRGDFVRLGRLRTATSVNRSYAHATPQQLNETTVFIALTDSLMGEVLNRDRLGRLLVIESDAYPIPWVGIITDAEGNEDTGEMQIQASGWGLILRQRLFGAIDGFTGTPGNVFLALLDRLNAINTTGLVAGAVSDPGTPYELDLREADGFGALVELADQTGQEWWLDVEQADASGVALTLNYGFRGENLVDGGRTLHDLRNCEVPLWGVNTQQGAFATTITGGQAALTQSYGARNRATAVTSAGSGILDANRAAPAHQPVTVQPGDLRLRHGVVFFPEATGGSPPSQRHELRIAEHLRGLGAIAAAAEAALVRRSHAARRAMVSCGWDGPGSWDDLRPGNVLQMVSSRAFGGFEGPVSIVGVQPMEEGGWCDVNIWISEEED